MEHAEWSGSDRGGFRETEVLEYQAVSPLAVGGLALGLLSAGATIWPLLWVAPPLGVVLNLIALRRIVSNPATLTGRRLALVGLGLSAFFTVMVPVAWLAYRWGIRQEARQFAAVWFDTLRDDRPVEAYQLTVDPRYRRPMEHFRRQARTPDSEVRRGLKDYVEKPEIRALLALGSEAQVRHYATEAYAESEEDKGHTVVDVYAVTCGDGGEKKTFFIRLGLQRYELPNHASADWHVASCSGGCKPIALGGDGKK